MGFTSWWGNDDQDFYGPTNEELGYVPPAQPGMFENIWSSFAQSPHLQSAGDYFGNIINPENQPDSVLDAIKNIGLGGFRGLQEIGKAGGEALGILPAIETSEDIIGAPYRQLGYLAEKYRTGQEPVMKPGASMLEAITGSGLQNVPPAGQIAREGLQSLGALGFGGTLEEVSQIAQGNANFGDVNPVVEQSLREANPLSFGFNDVAEPVIDTILQLGLDPASPGMAMAGGNPTLARILGGINLPSDVMDVVDTSGQAVDVGMDKGFTSPEGIRALSTFGATGLLTGADVAPEALNTGLNVGPVIPGESNLGSEAGVFKFGDIPQERLDKTQEELIDNLRTEIIPESDLIPVDPVQEAFQESQQNALNAKVNELQNLGFGENTIGGLTSDQANEIISGQTQRESYNLNKTYEEQVQEIMRQNMTDRTFAEEILANEGIYPPTQQTQIPEPIDLGSVTQPINTNQIQSLENLIGEPAIPDPRENLQLAVNEVKEKYGKTWKKKLTSEERSTINTLQMELSRKVPLSQENTSPAYKEAFEKGEIPEHYTERKEVSKEELEKAKKDVKAKVKAIGPAPIPFNPTATQPVQIPNVPPPALTLQQQLQASLAQYQNKPKQLSAQSLMGTQTLSKIPPPSTPKPPKPPKVSKPSSPKVPPLQLKPLGRLERAVFTEERNVVKTSPEISKAEKAFREYHEVESSKAIGDLREATQGMKGSEKKIISRLNGNPVQLTGKESAVANILNGIISNVSSNPPKFNSFSEIETHISSQIKETAKKRFLNDLKFEGDKETKAYVRNYINNLKGNVQSGPVAKVASKLRQAVALGNLQLTQILQAGQFVHTATYGGFIRSIKAIPKMLGKNYKKAELQAIKDGALWPTISHEVGAALGDSSYMHGTPTVDKALRIHANIVGKMLLEDAKKGQKYANRIVNELGGNLKSDPGLIGKRFSDKTQFRTDLAHLPGWAHTTAGKMVWQYSHFAYRHSKFMYDMISGGPKNAGQVLRMAILAGTVGEGIGDVRAIIRALVPGDDEDDDLLRRELAALSGDPKFSDKKFSEKLQSLMRNDRIPIWTSPGWRIIQNMSMVGGAGIFGSIIEKILNAKSATDILKVVSGPAVSQVAELFGAGIKDVKSVIKKPKLKSIREVPKEILKKAPFPFWPGSKIAGKVFPPKSSGGRTMFPNF